MTHSLPRYRIASSPFARGLALRGIRWLAAVLAVASAGSLSSAPAMAQTLTGELSGEGRWLVQIRGESGARVARGVSSAGGSFALAVPGAGRYSVTATAPGHAPVRGTATVSGEDTARVVFPAAETLPPLSEPGAADRVCSPSGELGPVTAEAWRRVEVVLALAAEELAAGTLTLDAAVFSRELAPDGERVLSQEPTTVRTAVSRVAPSVDAADLLERGFIRAEEDGSFRFFGPSVEVLLSPFFTETHCLRLQPQGELTGIAFEPLEREEPRPDVAGVIWVETATGNPVLLEFGYRNTEETLPLARAGGRTTFAPLPDGSWITVEGWMRLPLLEAEVTRGDSVPERWTLGGLREEGYRVTGVRTAEGAFSLDGPAGRLEGVLTKHERGEPLADATVFLAGTPYRATTDQLGRFAFDGLLEGTYALAAQHPELDVLPMGAEATARIPRGGSASVALSAPTPEAAARQLCGEAPRSGRTAGAPAVVLSGQVTDSITGEPLSGVPLNLRFRDPRRDGTPVHETRIWTGTGGEFLYCDLPPMQAVSLRAVAPGIDGSEEFTFSTGPSGAVRKDLRVALSTEQSPGGVFGTVREYGTIRGIDQAQVRVKDTDVSVLTNRSGFFAIPDLPQGLYVLEVSALGYQPREIVVRLSGTNAFNVEVELAADAIAVEGITVTAVPRRVFGDMVSMHQRMALGGGTFVMKAELDRRGGNLSQILQGKAGVRIVPSPDRAGGYYAVLRGQQDLEVTVGPEQQAGGNLFNTQINVARVNCYPAIWVDGQPASTPKVGGVGHNPVDLTRFLSYDIEAVEVYKGAASVPGEFGAGTAACGAIVIWSRRGGVTLRGEARGDRGGGGTVDGGGAGTPRPEARRPGPEGPR